jgi:hypothetical protein
MTRRIMKFRTQEFGIEGERKERMDERREVEREIDERREVEREDG